VSDLDYLRTWASSWARWKFRRVLTRLCQIRPLPPRPIGTLVVGHARFPIRESIVLREGRFCITGTAINPFLRRLDPSVRTYQILGEDGEVVHKGKLPDFSPLHGVTTFAAMKLVVTVQLDIREARWP
jgi:hypothetical protein